MNNVIKKSFMIAIILFFLCSTIVSSFNIQINNKNNLMINNQGNTLCVGGNGPGNYSNIQSAIDDAKDGDTVFVFSGIYYENINLNKSINLIGENSKNTIIESESKINHNPINYNPSPINGATDIELPPNDISIYVSDADGDTMNITFWTNESGTWTLIQTNSSVVNGTYYLMNKSWVDDNSTIYWWRVITSDGENGFDDDAYNFITIGQPKFRLWVITDTHVKVNYYCAFNDAISDSNTAFIWNASIAIGDLIHNDLVDRTYPEYNRWQQVRNISIHGVQDFYPIYGNHEMYHNGSGWVNWTKQMDPVGDHWISNNTNENRTYDMINRLDESHPLSNSNDSRYYFAVGNLLFVTFGPYPNVRNHTIWFNWFRSIIENNSNMNIIVYTHFPLPTCGLFQGGGYQWEDSKTYESWLNSTSTTINLWLSGHTHGLGNIIYNSTTTYNNWNITFIDPGNVFDARSTLLNFTDGSPLVVLGRYYHRDNNWIYNTIVNLTYPFDIDYIYSPPINWTHRQDLNITFKDLPTYNTVQELNTNMKNTNSRTGLQNSQIRIYINGDTTPIYNSHISGFTLPGNNDYNSIGIYSQLNSNNIIIKNCIIHNFGDGIFFANGCNNITIRNCTTYNNLRHGGISFAGKDINKFEISRCISYLNTYGINIEDSTNGLIYQNNLFKNNINAYDSGKNIWDNGKYGNYWDDYIKKYPNAHKILLKGIWDLPYNITGGENQDSFPLVNPFNKPRNRINNILSYNLLKNDPKLYIIFQKILTKLEQ